jgi:hypothetical protein
MPWLEVNQTLLCRFSAVPAPVLALDVHRGGMPGHPGAYTVLESLMKFHFLCSKTVLQMTEHLQKRAGPAITSASKY